ncbi:hypothetical protein BUALT_Bualt02G0235900 [Buddleja alternifolia]|uniref:Gamma-tubulin complex component n=1 Tax=Buddleja alternifolia TaxID=168488 RepID=A0AAV6YDI0_9LAMI|nr:hypothetical protein BUALT_Bualt02G0235900 [Buddleja alternifolia]
MHGQKSQNDLSPSNVNLKVDTGALGSSGVAGRLSRILTRLPHNQINFCYDNINQAAGRLVKQGPRSSGLSLHTVSHRDSTQVAYKVSQSVTMLHELLLALLGYTGDLIIDEREQQESLRVNLSPQAPLADEPTFNLAPDISFLEPSDRENIKIGARTFCRTSNYTRVLSWIRSSNESLLSRATELLKGKKVKPSVYRRALLNGIVEVLSVYRSAVLHIEQKLLSDSLPILATVTQGLNKVGL